MTAPPFEEGAVKETVACPLPGVAETAVGASGTVTGVTAEDADESDPDIVFLAVTVNV